MIVLYIEQFSPANRHSELIEKLVDIWHKSVCATHLFLTDSDINEIKRFFVKCWGIRDR